MIYEIRDDTNRKIRLTKERWKHIAHEHPEIRDITDIFLTVKHSQITKQSKYDERVVYKYRYQKGIRKYLMVAVKYLNGDGFIITAHYMRRIK